jgi:PAS domain S-box-containing protein
MAVNQSSNNSSFKRLAAINRAITTSLNFSEVLRLIVVNAAELFTADTSVLLLTDSDGTLRVNAAHGQGSDRLATFSGRMEETVIRDLSKQLGLNARQTLVTVPVITGGSVSGFLAIARETPLNDEEQWQMAALADQAAIALRNAHLYEMELAEAGRERDQSNEALRESNDKIKTILESITDLFYSLDREWRFTDINGQTEKRFGKKRDELIGKVIWEVYPQTVNSAWFLQFNKAIDEMVPVHFEVASVIVAGTWFDAHAYPAAAGLTVYLRDITERRQAEITKHLLAAIVESSGDAIISKDLNGVINSWNQGAKSIFGYDAAEAIGQPVTLLIPEDRFDEEPSILERIRKGERVDHYETIRRHKDGHLIDISLAISPIKDEQGKIIGASKIARDISERILQEQEIAFQARLLSAVEQAVIASDLNGVVTYWNPFAESLYGWSAAEAVGARIVELTVAPDTESKAVEVMERVRQGQSWSGEFLVRRKDGTTFVAMVTDWPIYDLAGAMIGVVGVSVDLTETKAAEAELSRLLQAEREARAEAERANTVKDEFLATMSHELRNPLNVILGYTEILLRHRDVEQSDFVKHAVEILKRNAQAQTQLVEDLLDLSRLHTGKLSLAIEHAVSFKSVVANAVETVRAAAAEKKVRLDFAVPSVDCLVTADPLRLQQIVWNLLNNAVKFTPSGGNVKIELAGTDSEAVLQVSDNGMGIDPAFLPSVFEMFRQADSSSSRKHGGMGIGLALVRQLVGLHGGSVSAGSEGSGKGARFTVRLPLSRETTITQADVTAPVVGERTLSHMRVLIIDDSPDTLEMLHHLLELEGARVSDASSGAEALRIAQHKEFDVVLSDISMPGMDGFEFLRQLRAIPLHQNVPVMALTGFGRVEDVKRAMAEGFFSHVTKPLDADHLLEILRGLAREHGARVGA